MLSQDGFETPVRGLQTEFGLISTPRNAAPKEIPKVEDKGLQESSTDSVHKSLDGNPGLLYLGSIF